MPVTVSCSRCGAVYSVPEAQLGQPLWCQCGQSIAVAAPPPAVGPGLPAMPGASQPMHWAAKFLLGYRAVRIVAILGIVIALAISQFTHKPRPNAGQGPPPAEPGAPNDPEAPLPPPQMPWPSGSVPAPVAPPGGAPSPQMTPGVLMGEPLLPKGAQGKVVSAAQAQNAEEVVVEFTWPREPTDDDRDRCFAVVSVGDPNVDMAAMALQGMAGPSPARIGPRDAQFRSVQGIQAASNRDWATEAPAEGATQRRCRITVSLKDPTGLSSVTSGTGGPKDAWVQLFDFGTMPPTPLSQPLKTRLTLP